MPSWQGKSKSNTTGYQIFVFLIKTFGIRAAYVLLTFITAYYFFFSPSSSKIIFSFYRQRLEFGRIQSLLKLYRNYYLLGQTLIDKVALMANIPTAFTFDFDGEDHLREMVKQQKGGLLLSAHIGNWEAAGHLLKRLQIRIHIVMFDGENEQIKKYLETVTGTKSFNIIYVKNDLSHIYKINEALAAHEIVCLHGDRFLPGNKTLSCEFLGKEALFPEGPFLLALKLKVPVAYVYAFKETNTHYHFYSTELKYFYKSKEMGLEDLLKDFVQHTENMIKRYPEQWFNYYDFWNTSNNLTH